MSLLEDIDPNGLLEYSVVFTDKSLNHMSKKFQQVMQDLASDFKNIYNAFETIIVPGGGTFAMESIVRQIAKNQHCMTLRNGFFNYRWSQIFYYSNIIPAETVIKAIPIDNSDNPQYQPALIDNVINEIYKLQPRFVFATHVETSAGIILPDDYIKQVSDAIHTVNGFLILDCVASGAVLVDMQKLGVDFLITAPQKGWSSSPCAGIVLLGENSLDLVEKTSSDSYSLDLQKWLEIIRAYKKGSYAYHSTLPTDSLTKLRDTIQAAKKIGFKNLEQKQWELGDKVRTALTHKGIKSIAASGFEAPSVIVCYTDDDDIHNGKKFVENGVQITSGVPLKIEENENFKTFRIGLFGLDKLMNVDRTYKLFVEALDKIFK